MFDIRTIRDDPAAFDAAMRRRQLEPQSDRLLALDAERREHIAAVQDAQTRRNAASKAIGQAKAAGNEEAARKAIADVAEIKRFLQSGEERERELTAALNDALAALPNVPMPDVPEGAGEAENTLHSTHGDRPGFNFTPREHFELGETMGTLDFDVAGKIAGSRFSVLSGSLARLERALGQFMLDLQTGEHGYLEVSPPLLVRDEAMFGTGQLPKFADDLFRTTDGRWLIPTAEVPLTNLVREQIVEAETLPRRYTALTPCFRSEAGSAGRDTRGILRQHQFTKCELVSVTDAETGEAELERMLGCAEEVLRRLGLHYRVMLLSTGDMGFGARKTYDIEVWLPGQNGGEGAYREISSCSYCGDFQARRMNARYRTAEGPRFVHTLNGSGLAVGRTLIAVMENYQAEDGSVGVPEALRPYLPGIERVGP